MKPRQGNKTFDLITNMLVLLRMKYNNFMLSGHSKSVCSLMFGSLVVYCQRAYAVMNYPLSGGLLDM